MSLLIVFWGESYRSGSQMTRSRGQNNYIQRQMFASQSHINLINKLNKKFNIDVFINTYELNKNDDANLINFYLNNGVNICKKNIHQKIFPNENMMLNNIYDNTFELIKNKNYDFILFIRIDLYLKKYFIENINFDNNIKFAHIDSNLDTTHANKTGLKGICQQIMLYPKNFFYVIQNKIIYNANHDIYNKLVQNNISNNYIDYFVNTLNICSTDLGWNPLYVQVGRKYSLFYNHYNNNYVYDKSSNLLIFDKDKTTAYWNNYIINEENLENNEIMLVTNY